MASMCLIRKFWVQCNIVSLPRELSRATPCPGRLSDEVNDTNTVSGLGRLLELSLTGGSC